MKKTDKKAEKKVKAASKTKSKPSVTRKSYLKTQEEAEKIDEYIKKETDVRNLESVLEEEYKDDINEVNKFIKGLEYEGIKEITKEAVEMNKAYSESSDRINTALDSKANGYVDTINKELGKIKEVRKQAEKSVENALKSTNESAKYRKTTAFWNGVTTT